MAIGKITGNNMAVVAILEVISVKKLTEAIMMISSTIKLIEGINSNCMPIHSANPVALNPAAMDSPPPKRISIPQGIVTASFQCISFWFFFEEGIINNNIALAIAIMESSKFGIKD